MIKAIMSFAVGCIVCMLAAGYTSNPDLLSVIGGFSAGYTYLTN
jgi:hypothetical protein